MQKLKSTAMRFFELSQHHRRAFLRPILVGLIFWAGSSIVPGAPAQSIPAHLPGNIQVLLDTLPPLSHPVEDRGLLYQYSVGDLSGLSDQEASEVIQALASRGVGVITFWVKGKSLESRIAEGIRIARIQHRLGLQVAVDATQLLYGFYDGTAATAHIDADGKAFFDSSFAGHAMGCPFTLQNRVPIINSLVTAYANSYAKAGVPIDMVTADWEIDGPLEWNQAWEAAKRCVRCLQHMPDTTDFRAFQDMIRSLRSTLIRQSYTLPILQRFPDALVTNYATYPNNGWRYWYDYFESPQPELPHQRDQQAVYRPWYQEFPETGFTMAMPVVYTWYPTFNWYPAYSPDYRWFYNMLLVGSNAGQSTPPGIPIATFVHWHTTALPEHPDPKVRQMSKQRYQELLWHLLLRGHDFLFSWCKSDELPVEMRLLQEVYNESLRYNDWFRSGRPITFTVPTEEQSVVSGFKWGNRVLVRRTDFTDFRDPITLTMANGDSVIIPWNPGKCQILLIKRAQK